MTNQRDWAVTEDAEAFLRALRIVGFVVIGVVALTVGCAVVR